MSWKSIVLIIVFGAATTRAVCVNGHPSIPAEFHSSKMVILGKIVGMKAVRETQDNYFLEGTMYQVDVQKRFKDGGAAAFEIFSENSSGRFNMSPGESYLLFVYEEHGRLMVDNCGNSGLESKSADTIRQVKKLAHR